VKFILVDYNATQEFTSERRLQSPEFEEGAALADFLSNGSGTTPFSKRIAIHRRDDGYYLISPSLPKREHFIVFDLVQAPRLFASPDRNERVTAFQRILRMAIRLWNNLALSSSERLIANTNKVCVFPFPLGTRSSYRITVERQPDEKRTSKRNTGNHLLVYKESYDEGGGSQEVVDIAIFRAALSGLQPARSEVTRTTKLPPSRTSDQIHVTTLDSSNSPIDSHLSIDHWLNHLTTQQRDFVQREVAGPERIEGPAGCGKTLCLVLRCIQQLRRARESKHELHAIFVAHSAATENAIRQLFIHGDPDAFHSNARTSTPRSVTITTLQRHCASIIGQDAISDAEYLDQDAAAAKEARLLYISESVDTAITDLLPSYRAMLSPTFLAFLDKEDRWTLTEMIQHEIAVMIKGRAQEDLDRYKELPGLAYNLPLATIKDRNFIYNIYLDYQRKLRAISQFDTDDIVLSAMGTMNTPLWRRRREREGFDVVYVDETHLFNLNELSVFHHITRSDGQQRIVYSADRSQATGDRGLTSAVLTEAISTLGNEEETTSLRTVFRCSPQIAAVAMTITASGVSLFTNFEDPLRDAGSIFTEAEERLAMTPRLILRRTDDLVVVDSVATLEKMAKDLNSSKADVLLVVFDPALFEDVRRHVASTNKPFELLRERGDLAAVKRAHKGGKYLLALPDYVGGLEFAGVVLAGVDEGRVPPFGRSETNESRHFLNFSYHNKLYVTVTRAKYRLDFIVNEQRGPTPMLRAARERNLVSVIESSQPF
jgi:superfamily I DNA/RNA helicase